MTPEPINIQWLVAEVIRRLEKLAAVPPPEPQAPAEAPRNAAAVGDLVLETRVVTLAAIERSLQGVRRVVVPRGAVVTPSVKDELRKRRIQLEFAAQPKVERVTATELTVARCTRTPEASRAAAALTPPAGANVVACDDLASAAKTVATVVGNAHRLGVLLTDEPLPAVCLANRLPTARAAWVRSVAEVREAIAAIGVNLLVIDPTQMEPAGWQELLSVYRQGLPRRCPPRLMAAPGTR